MSDAHAVDHHNNADSTDVFGFESPGSLRTFL